LYFITVDLIHELRGANNFAIDVNNRWIIPDMKSQVQ
jgi:hypothetical protein